MDGLGGHILVLPHQQALGIELRHPYIQKRKNMIKVVLPWKPQMHFCTKLMILILKICNKLSTLIKERVESRRHEKQ